ncbi:hypothetical protein [Sphingomonas sp. CCH10-B3]|uniref:hypothetical protein n=1 Tax=Sphingomonas sp. CCH10-B3 TaxID=1768757 RepID=UPI00082E4CCA|nr:hypothetical protein [Sphingomonas sp. CCH10-B3]
MMKKFTLASVAIALSASALVPVAPAAAQYRGDGYYQNDGYRGYDDRGYDRRDYRDYRDNRWDDRRDYRQNYRYDYRNNYRRNRCDATTGTILGAIVGGLLGNGIAGRGDRAAGTIVGGAGNAIAKDGCRR